MLRKTKSVWKKWVLILILQCRILQNRCQCSQRRCQAVFRCAPGGFPPLIAPLTGSRCPTIVHLLLWGYGPQRLYRQQRAGDFHHPLILIHCHFPQRLPGLLFLHSLMNHQHAFRFFNQLALFERIF